MPEISFEYAFKSWRMNSTLFWKLIEGDHRDHNCGWTVRPLRTELLGQHVIYACWGCGSCFQAPDDSAVMVAA